MALIYDLSKPAPMVGELVNTPCDEDLILWSDNCMCYAYELEDFSFMSDDYERIPMGTTRYMELTQL